MTQVVDARDVDHVVETIEATLQCQSQSPLGGRPCAAVAPKDPCAVCVAVGLLRQARRFQAYEPPFAERAL